MIHSKVNRDARRYASYGWIVALGAALVARYCLEEMGVRLAWQSVGAYTAGLLASVIFILRAFWTSARFWLRLLGFLGIHLFIAHVIIQSLMLRRGIPGLVMIPIGILEVLLFVGLLLKAEAGSHRRHLSSSN
jgi:hypothetical protein